ncbi:hypothetical protein EUGRSUZ_H04545 [Eucalyptus grandis]|uniref:Uncharacterized protein n=2 Tax=Eucalyptus grandis TaxID=71139 RepID=A0A059B7J4_EUCGR|nr:hypothetical protein EUGRSUZ_H04545 [Eucalyptus grandis]
MGLLDQLWDDTVAGPRPESGLGKLRKFSTFSSRSNSGKESEGGGRMKAYGDPDATPSEEAAAIRVTRSITIVKPPGNQSGTPPVSPAGSTPPVSPFAGGGGGRGRSLFRRRSMSDAYEKPSEVRPRSPPSSYDM